MTDLFHSLAGKYEYLAGMPITIDGKGG